MAINLNPGADAVVAGAAARAGAALTPADYGATFRDFSTKYQAAMATVGESWSTTIQAAGLKAAQIKQSANKIRENYGSNVTNVVFDDTKDLARQRFDIMKGYSGSYVNGEWVRGPKFSEMDDPKGAKQKAKQDWRKRKDARFNQLRQMEQNVFEVGQHFVTNNVDVGALNPAEASMVDAIMNEGEYNEDGIRASLQLNEDGTEYTYVFYGEDDKPISGFDEITGAPIYVDGTGEMEAIEAKARDFPTPEYDRYNRRQIPIVRQALEEGSLDSWADWDRDVFESSYNILQFQLMLNEMGYTGADGKPLEVDGWLYRKDGKQSNTEFAFEQFKKDQEAKEQVAGDLWSDISGLADRSPLSLNTNEMSSLFVTKDIDAQEKVNTIGLERGLNSGLNTNLEFDENQVRQDINNVINDAENPANTLKHLMHNTVIGMEYSFKDYLTTPGTVYSEAMWQEIDRLGQMGLIEDTSGPNGVPDNKYTIEDFKDSDAANFRALAKEMLNPNNAKAKELFIDFLTNGVRNKFDAGRAAKGKGTVTETETGTNVPSGVPSVGKDKFQGTGSNIWTSAADVQGVVNRLYGGTIDFNIDGKTVTFTRNEETNWWDADGYDSISGTDVVAGLQATLGEGAYEVKNHSAVIPFLEDRRTVENVSTGIVDGQMIVMGVNYGDAGDWTRDEKTGNFYKKAFGSYKQAAEGGNVIYSNKGAYTYGKDDEIITEDSHVGQTWQRGERKGQAIVPQYDWAGKIDGNWLNKKQAELLAEILKGSTEEVKSR